MMSVGKPEFPRATGTVGRRTVLQGLLGVGAIAALGACSDRGANGSDGNGSATSWVRVGGTDSTSNTGLDIRKVGFGLSTMVTHHLYESLVYLGDGRYTNGLAEQVTPDATATTWKIVLRQGARFHDGRPVTAEDVLASIKLLATPPSNRVSTYAIVDLERSKVENERTVVVALKVPRADFREAVLGTFSPVVPAGADPEKGIGSGPYRLEGVDGDRVRLVAVEGEGGRRPLLQKLELMRIADPAARLSAVQRGEIAYALNVSAVGARSIQQNKKLMLRNGGVENSSVLSFAMNQTMAPFDNPEVRKAVRLAVDRQALVDGALQGFGVVGNDLVGMGQPGYAEPPQRARDVAEAKRLFAAAGVDKLTLQTAEIAPGVTNAARLLVQQLAEVGVAVTLKEQPADTYYADLPSLSKRAFQAFYYDNRPPAVHLAAVTVPRAPFNVTKEGEAHAKELAAAQVTIDPAKREAAFKEIQQRLYTSGGDLIWGYSPRLDVCDPAYGDVPRLHSVPTFVKA